MKNAVKTKSFLFAIRIVNLHKYLTQKKKETVLSKQILRSGTSIGANVAESQEAQSRPDFVSKMNIALKEAQETNYWLRLLHATNYLKEKEFLSLITDCEELQKLLTTIIITARQPLND